MKKCGFTGKKCIKNDCIFWQQFRGMNPMTGKEEDKFECSHVMMPIIMVEVASQLRGLTSATESARNEINRSRLCLD